MDISLKKGKFHLHTIFPVGFRLKLPKCGNQFMKDHAVMMNAAYTLTEQ